MSQFTIGKNSGTARASARHVRTRRPRGQNRFTAILGVVAVMFGTLTAVVAGPAPQAQAAEINLGTITGRVYDHIGTAADYTTPVGGTDNCIRYDPKMPGQQSSTWATSVKTGHGRPTSMRNCPQNWNAGQSTVGIEIVQTPVIPDGQLLPLGIITHYNRPVYSGAQHFTGELGVRFEDFGNIEVGFGWSMWETPNTNNCPPGVGGTNGQCNDLIKFTSPVSEIVLEQNGIPFRLVIQGFGPTAPGGQCPANPSANFNPAPEFWTQENSETSACIYGYFSQVRELTVHKNIVGTPSTPTTFEFTSNGSMEASPWDNGTASVTPTVGTPSEVFKNEIYRFDQVTITETNPDDEYWKLTGLTCTETNAAGQVVPLTTQQVEYNAANGSITLSNIGAPPNAAHPNIDCTFTNTFQAGSINVTKDVIGAADALTNPGKAFDVTINCGPNHVYTRSITEAAGVTIDNLPVGRTCTVTETAPSGDLQNSSYYWGSASYSPPQVTIVAGETAEVVVSNPIEQRLGNLEISKTIQPKATEPAPAAGYTGGPDRQFPVVYTCDLDGATVASGSGSISTGTPLTVTGIPAGAVCTVTEDPVTLTAGDFSDVSYQWVAGNPVSGTATIVVNDTANVALVNEYERIYSTLTIAKIVDPADGVTPGTTFTGTYTCGDMTGTWSLADGEDVTIPNIPVGTSCTVTEDAPGAGLLNGSWSWNNPAFNVPSVTVTEDGAARITVTNNATQQFGTFTVTKAVEGPDGGFTGATHGFPVNYTCTIADGPELTGSVTITNGQTSAPVQIPAGYECALTETLTPLEGDFADASYEWTGNSFDDDSLTIVANQNAAATVTNTYTRNYTSIEVKKVVNGAGLLPTADPFTITYNCGTGEQQLQVPAGGSATIPNVPVGTKCTLAEVAPSEDMLAPAYDWGTPAWTGLDANGQITAVKDAVASATVTNPTVPVFGTVTVTKLVTTPGVVAGTTFPITVTCGDYTNTFNLADGASGTTDPLPVGTSCTVSEQMPTGRAGLVDDSYSWGAAPTDQTVTIATANQNVPVTVQNSTVRNDFGELTVTKNLVAPAGVVNQVNSYTGTWTCKYGDDPAITGTWTVPAGGTTTVASDILLGSTCTVTENSLPSPSSDPSYVWAGATYSPNGGEVSLTWDAPEANVTVTNSVDRVTGSFAVTKSVVGDGYVPGSTFPFTWQCTGEGWDGASGQFNLAAGQTWTPEGIEIPADATCTITEGADPVPSVSHTWDGVTWTGANVTVTQEGRAASFTVPAAGGDVPTLTATNALSKKFGSVQFGKALTGATDGYVGGAFTVNLACGDFGNFSTTVTPDGVGSIDNVPLGATCEVSESSERPALKDASYAWGSVTIDKPTVTISAPLQVVNVLVTNDITRVYGSVQVSKTLTAPDGIVDPAREYSGTWSCQYLSDPAVTGTWTIPAGQTTAVLSDEILVGSVCTATENALSKPSTDPSYRWLTPEITDATVTAAGDSAIVVVENEVVRDLSSVTVTKTLSGAAAGYTGGTDAAFQVNYVCSAEGVEGVYTGSTMVAAGAGPVDLFENQPAGIPDGWSCTVTETVPDPELLADGSFAWGEPTVSPSTFVVGETADLNVAIDNPITRVKVPVTLDKTLVDTDRVTDPERTYRGTWTCTYPGDDPVTGEWASPGNGPEITLSDDILVGSTCTAVETGLEDAPAVNADPSYVWKVPAITPVTTTERGGKITVANEVVHNTGSVTVAKTVTGETAGLKDPATPFTVAYTCTAGNLSMNGTTTVTDGSTVTISDIPVGWDCEFSEVTPAENLLTDESYSWETATISPDKVKLETAGETVSIAVENPIVRAFADVKVDKELVDPKGVVDPARVFTGTVTCTFGEDDPITGSWSLSASDPAVLVDFDGLRPLVGSKCTVSEDSPGVPTDLDPSYTFAAPEMTSVETLPAAGATLVVTNTVERKLGSIALTKEVTGEKAGYTGGTDAVFEMTYTCAPPNGTPEQTGTVMLADGQTYTVESVPVGWTCSVTETAPTGNLLDGSYTWGTPVIAPDTVTVTADTTAELKITNPILRDLRMVDLNKTVTSATQLPDGSWKVVYQIVVSNPLNQGSIYSLTDTLNYGEGITPTSAQWRESGGTWTAWTDPSAPATLATDRTILANGDDAYADHVYEVEVISTLAQGVVGTTPATCQSTDETAGGGFLNTARVDVEDEHTTDIACEEPTTPELKKTFTSATQNAGATWTVSYGITVNNTAGNAGYYDLADIPGFPADVTITSWSVTAQGTTPAVTVAEQYTDGVIATGVPIAAGETHSYTVTFVVDVPVTINESVQTCSTEGEATGHGFYNMAQLTSGNQTRTDDDCGPIDEGGVPAVAKSIVSNVQQPDGSWIVEYEIRVSANPDYNTSYDLTDSIRFGAGATITSATWTGPTSGTFELGDQPTAVLAEDRPLAKGAPDEVYTVTVQATVESSSVGTPTMDCRIVEGETGTGFLNQALLYSGGWTGEDQACGVPVLPSVAKEAVGLEKNLVDGTWDGTWNATYRLTVTNPATDGQEVTYTLNEAPAFAAGVETIGQSVTSDAEGLPDGWADAFNEGGMTVIADRTTGATQEVYTVVFNLKFTPAIAAEDRQCADDSSRATGLANGGILLSGGTTDDDDACIEIPGPSIDVAKTLVSATEGKGGMWTIVYEVKASNTSDVPVAYTLTDTLKYGEGIVPTAAEWAQVDGELAGTWADPAGNATQALATDVELAPLSSHTYRITVTAKVGDGVAGTLPGRCVAEGAGTGGFLNTVTLDANGLTDNAWTCGEPTVPEKPEPPKPPKKPEIPRTGVGGVAEALTLALMLTASGVVLLGARRRQR